MRRIHAKNNNLCIPLLKQISLILSQSQIKLDSIILMIIIHIMIMKSDYHFLFSPDDDDVSRRDSKRYLINRTTIIIV